MTQRLYLGLVSFAALSGAVLANVFYLQPLAGQRAQRIELGPSPEVIAPKMISNGDANAHAAPADDTYTTTRAVQRELESRGYVIGASDGVAGLVTRAAIMAYEYDHGLALTGEPTPYLLQTIILGTAASETVAAANPRVGPHAEQVIRTTQQSLVGLGYGPIKVDGILGETTVRAIRRFEQQQSMPQTGRISGLMVSRLARLAALGQVQSAR